MPDEEMVSRISVRGFVEFLLRSGDIDQRSGGLPDRDAMQMGSRLHRRIQKSMGSDYEAEVPLSADFPCDDFIIRVEGRADGIIRPADGQPADVVVDEIKGILRPVESLEEPVPVHLAQAKCYACFLAGQEGHARVGVQMTYANLETEEIRRFHFLYTKEELDEWFLALLESWKKWARFEREWKKTRLSSIHQTAFPFPWREGQKNLARDVYRTIARGKILFIEAPTGVGKTISTVFPSVKAVGEGLGEKIFYLTARTVARTVAAEAFAQLRKTGLRWKSIVLTAKEKICPLEKTVCNPDSCPYAKGHYDRINDALYELITGQDVFDRESVLEAADRYMLCPYELSLDLAVWMDSIIGDYNYLFHPRSRLRRFFGEGVRGDYLFLIDEAHNLVDRGRDMYSASLYKEDFLTLRRAVRGKSSALAKSLGTCSRRLAGMKKDSEGVKVLTGIGTLPVSLLNLCGEMEEFMEHAEDPELTEQVRDLYFQVTAFLSICDVLDENYVIYQETEGDGRFKVKLFCVNPAAGLQQCMDKGRSSILFSATLLPIDYYQKLLSTRTDLYAVYARSCFDPANFKVLIGGDTSTRYTRRNEAEYIRIARYILQAVSARKGNYMVFFPSYRMLEEVWQQCAVLLPGDVELVCQDSHMDEERRELFLEQFREDREKSLVAFCVMGSVFGEGIDLKNDRLIGVIVTGPGIPMVCTEQNLLREYYERQGMDGFRFAYQCPGMNRVLQAAGRVIRTEQDKGMVLLLDERFLEDRYRRMFPREWNPGPPCTLETARERLREFWDG